MISKIAALSYTISSVIAPADAFTITAMNKQPTTTHLNYRDQHYNDEWFTAQNTAGLPSGAFGTLPSPTFTEQDVASYQDSNSYMHNFIQTESLIPSSSSSSSSVQDMASYSPELDLPSSATVVDENISFHREIEVYLGRIAMMAAIVMIGKEIVTGASFAEQFVQLLGGHIL